MKPYYTTNLGALYYGDCLEVMSELKGESINLTITSPPYDDLREYEGYSFLFEPVAQELYRLTLLGGVVVWVVGDATVDGSETGTSFKQALYFKDIGFKLHDTMIYSSHKPPLTHNRYEQKFEFMFVLSKGKPKVFNPIMVDTLWGGSYLWYGSGLSTQPKKEKKGAMRWRKEGVVVKQEKIKGNIWEYKTGYMKTTKDRIAFEHPAVFPEGLAVDHILSWSNEGDMVFDPLCGSGTTCKMAEELNRQWLGIESSEAYCKITACRIKHSRAQLKMF